MSNNIEWDSIIILGDFCPSLFSQTTKVILLDFFKRCNSAQSLVSINLECPLTNHHTPILKSGPNLYANTQWISVLREIGISICNLANNHIMDYGVSGLEDTIKLLEGKLIDYIGITEGEYGSRIVKTVNGKRIGFIAFTENEFSTLPIYSIRAIPLSAHVQFKQISELAGQVDHLIVQYHGGVEMYHYPTPKQQDYARFLIDIGASVVVCHHSHCISGYEVYNDKYIFYGLGNFYFPEKGNPPAWNIGALLGINVADKLEFNLRTINYCDEDDTLSLLPLKHSSYSFIEEINHVISVRELLEEKWLEYCRLQEEAVIKTLFSPNKIQRALMKYGFLRRRFRKRLNNRILNLFRCESHNEKMQTLLQILNQSQEKGID